MFQSVLVIFRVFVFLFPSSLVDYVTSKQWQWLNKLKALSRKLHSVSPECHHSYAVVSWKWDTNSISHMHTHIMYTHRSVELIECVGLDHIDDTWPHSNEAIQMVGVLMIRSNLYLLFSFSHGIEWKIKYWPLEYRSQKYRDRMMYRTKHTHETIFERFHYFLNSLHALFLLLPLMKCTYLQ